MTQLLAAPVEYGDTLLAPTIELAGLAELASIDDPDARLAAIVRIAHAIRNEDAARDEVARQRAAARHGLVELPRRH
jgi:hypothetical protein